MAAFCFALWPALRLPTALAAFMVQMTCGSVCLQLGHELRILLEPLMVFEENSTDSLCDLRRDLVHVDMDVGIHLCLLLLSVVSGLVVHIRQQHMVDQLQNVHRDALAVLQGGFDAGDILCTACIIVVRFPAARFVLTVLHVCSPPFQFTRDGEKALAGLVKGQGNFANFAFLILGQNGLILFLVSRQEQNSVCILFQLAGFLQIGGAGGCVCSVAVQLGQSYHKYSCGLCQFV